MRTQIQAPYRWRWTKVKHEAEFYTGWTPPTGDAESFEGDNLWANISDLGPKVLADTAKRISDKAVRKSAIRVSPAESVLFSFKLSIGQVSFAGRDMYTNEAIATFPPQPGLNTRWAYWAFPVFIPLNAGENIYGAKLLNQELIRSADLLVPPSDEQERIANFLDEQTGRIDALIAEKQKLLECVAELRLSEVHAAVSFGLNAQAQRVRTSDDWFSEVPSHWSFCPLNYRYEVQLGKMLDEKRITGAHLVPYLRNTDVQWGRINTENLPSMDIHPDEYSRYTVLPGDLLVCEGGEVGRAAIWSASEATVGYQKALHRVRPRSCHDVPRFLFYALYDSANRGRFEWREKATIAHLTAEAFRRYRFPFPPRDEQAAIAGYLDARFDMFDKTEAHCQEHIARLREYRSSLISAAVTGQLDLSTFKASA